MDEAIIHYIKKTYNLLIGERTAEEAKITASANRAANQPVVIRGRDVLTGLPSEIHAPPGEIDEAIAGSVNTIVDAVIDTLEETAPELVADVMQAGLTLVGGGGFLPILVDRLRARTKVRVNVADDPMACVVRGAGRVLVEPATMRRFVVDINTRRVAVRG
jgi:rod shape-determining protein MreB